MTDMALRPSASNPGRTYKWYTGMPVFEFGFGLHYTTFAFAWSGAAPVASTYSIVLLVARGRATSGPLDLAPFDTEQVVVRNTGKVTSDYVALLFVSGSYGPAPHPKTSLVSYTRLHSIAPGQSQTAQLPITLGSLARADETGAMWLYPGTYTLTLDTTGGISRTFMLTGEAAQIATWPSNSGSK